MSDSTVQIVGNNVVMPTGGKVTNLGTPTAAADAVTKAYADALSPAVTESAVRAAAAAFTAALAVNGQKITGLGTPTVSTDAVTKAYADALSPSVTESAVRAAAAAFTAAFNVNGQKITGLGTPTVSTDAVTKAYADSLSGAVTETAVRAAAASFSAAFAVNAQKITGLANGTAATDAATLGQLFARNGKPTVNAVATSNQATLTGLAQTIDGVALSVAGMLVALTNQTTGTQTGIYAVASGAWTLIPELASGASAAGAYFVCKTGTANKGVWVVTNAPGSDVVGTATLTFVNVTTSYNDAVVPALGAVTVQGAIDALKAWGPPTYQDTFTSTSATAAVVRNVPLSDNSLYRIAVVTIARDTTTHWYKKKSSTEWTRSTGGAATQLGSDDGPTPSDGITVTGMTAVSNANGVDLKYGGSGSVHTSGIMFTYVQQISVAAAT